MRIDKKKLEARLEIAVVIIGIIAALMSFYASYKLGLARYIFFGLLWLVIIIAVLRSSVRNSGGQQFL